ncbi:hypothetical protein GCM10027318_01990 [Massilia agilis]
MGSGGRPGVDRAEPGAVPHLRNPAAGEVMDAQRKSNTRLAWTIAAIPLFFFVMVFVKRIWFN